MTHRTNFRGFAVLLALLSLGCAGGNGGDRTDQRPSGGRVDHTLIGTQWKLASLYDTLAEKGAEAYLQLNAVDSRFGGSSGCNRYGGRYVLSEQNVTFGEIFATKMACLESSLMAQEARLFRVLPEVRAWRIIDRQLELRGAMGTVAEFVASDSL